MRKWSGVAGRHEPTTAPGEGGHFQRTTRETYSGEDQRDTKTDVRHGYMDKGGANSDAVLWSRSTSNERRGARGPSRVPPPPPPSLPPSVPPSMPPSCAEGELSGSLSGPHISLRGFQW